MLLLPLLKSERSFFMKGIPLTKEKKKEIIPGEAITLAAVLSILSISLIAVVVYRIFMS